jgi:uncharacterized protein
MPEESLKNKLLNNPKEINDPAILEEVSNLFELQEPETVYHTNGQQKKAIEEAKEQIKNPDIILQQYLPQIKSLMQQYDVQSAYAFGSAVKNTMQPGSDVDFVISFPADMDYETYSNNYFNLLNALRKLLQKEVDLVDEKTITNPYLLQSINQHKLKVL